MRKIISLIVIVICLVGIILGCSGDKTEEMEKVESDIRSGNIISETPEIETSLAVTFVSESGEELKLYFKNGRLMAEYGDINEAGKLLFDSVKTYIPDDEKRAIDILKRCQEYINQTTMLTITDQDKGIRTRLYLDNIVDIERETKLRQDINEYLKEREPKD